MFLESKSHRNNIWKNLKEFFLYLTDRKLSLKVSNSGFSQTHKIGNIGVNDNLIFPYIYNVLLYLHYMILVNVKLDVSGYKEIMFQGCIIHWSS